MFRLPDQLVQFVLVPLFTPDVIAPLSATCRHWRKLLAQEAIWKQLVARDCPVRIFIQIFVFDQHFFRFCAMFS